DLVLRARSGAGAGFIRPRHRTRLCRRALQRGFLIGDAVDPFVGAVADPVGAGGGSTAGATAPSGSSLRTTGSGSTGGRPPGGGKALAFSSRGEPQVTGAGAGAGGGTTAASSTAASGTSRAGAAPVGARARGGSGAVSAGASSLGRGGTGKGVSLLEPPQPLAHKAALKTSVAFRIMDAALPKPDSRGKSRVRGLHLPSRLD